MRNTHKVGSSYSQAKRENLRFYLSGPCKHGHDGLRVCNGRCLECHKGQLRMIAKTPQKKLESREYGRNKLRKQQEAAAIRPRSAHCEIPGCPTYGKVVYDHNHRTGAFRGWICERCNKTLGAVRDNPILLHHLAAYLQWGSTSTRIVFQCESFADGDATYKTRRQIKAERRGWRSLHGL